MYTVCEYKVYNEDNEIWTSLKIIIWTKYSYNSS